MRHQYKVLKTLMPILLVAAMLASLFGGMASISAQTGYTLTLNAENGSINADPPPDLEGGAYTSGTEVGLTAVPADGYEFVNWTIVTGGVPATFDINPVSVVMNANRTVTAHFQIKTYTLTINANNEQGTVSWDPVQDTYDHGTVVGLTATPVGDYHFVNWSGSANIADPEAAETTITMLENTTITANFSNEWGLTIVAENGTVTPDPDQDSYVNGTPVTLTAVPADGYHFVEWTGDAAGTETVTTITMDSDKTVTANFAINTYTLTVNAGEHGSITKDPPTGPYEHGEVVTLVAVPDEGYHLVEWGGDAGGSEDTTYVTMDSDKTVTASFAINNNYILDVQIIGTGTVDKSPNKTEYTHGESVTLTAVPGDLPNHFDYWTGDVPDSPNPAASITITMDGNKAITAHFADVFTLDIIAENGAVTKDLDFETYLPGQDVTLTADADEGYFFSHWSENGNAIGFTTSLSITMNSDRVITAHFAQHYTLEVSVTGSGSVTKIPDTTTYTPGEAVTLDPVPQAGYYFVGWTGDHIGSEDPLEINIISNMNITANFSSSVTLTKHAEHGSITTNPPSGPYAYNSEVTLTAVPADGYHFLNWSGDISSAENPVTITMDANKTVTAHFIQYADSTLKYGFSSFGQYEVGEEIPVDGFDSWHPEFGGGFEYVVEDGVYQTTGTPDYSESHPGEVIPTTGGGWKGYIYQADFRRLGEANTAGYTVLYFNLHNYVDGGVDQYSAFEVLIGQQGEMHLISVVGAALGGSPFMATAPIAADNDWHTASIATYGNMIEVYIDGELKISYLGDVADHFRSGIVGVGSHQWNSAFRNVKITGLDYWLVSNIDIQKRFFYDAEPEPVNISFLLDSSDAGDTVDMKITSPGDSEFTVGTIGVGQNTLQYPNDFTGADWTVKGRYTISMTTPAGEIEIPDGTFEYKDPPLLSFVAAANSYIDEYPVFSKPAENMVDSINNQNYFPAPDFISFSGNNAWDAGQIGTAYAILETLNVPYYITPGGSDVVGEAEGSRGQAFSSSFGNVYAYTAEIGGYVMIFVGDNCDYEPLTGDLPGGLYTQAMRDWLSGVLEANSDKQVFIFSHQGVVPFRDDGAATSYWIGDFAGAEVRSILEGSENVVAMFSGANRIIGAEARNGIVYASSGSVFNLPSAYRYVEVYSDKVYIHTVKFGIGQEHQHEAWYPDSDSTHTSSQYAYGLSKERDLATGYTLTTNVSGNGSITRNPDQDTFDNGETVQLTAVPNSGNRFVRWMQGSDSLGSANPLSVTMDDDKTISAVFSVITSSSGGGGGGSSLLTIRLTGWTSPTVLKTSSTGTRTAAQLKSADGKLTLEWSKGTRITRNVRELVSSLTLETLTDSPAPPANNALVLAYSFGPDGAAFDPAVKLSFSYDPAALPEGMSEEDLYIAFWDGTQWQVLDSQVDTQTGTVTASITHFSTYGLLGEVTPTQVPTPPSTPTQPASPLPSSSPTTSPSPTTAVPTQASPTAPSTTTPAPDKPASPFNWWLLVIVIVIVLAAVGMLSYIFINKKRKLES